MENGDSDLDSELSWPPVDNSISCDYSEDELELESIEEKEHLSHEAYLALQEKMDLGCERLSDIFIEKDYILYSRRTRIRLGLEIPPEQIMELDKFPRLLQIL